jgi:hypothetical protein
MQSLIRTPRRAIMLAAAALAALAVSAGAAQAAEPLPTGVPVAIVFEHSGKVANVAGADTAAGTPLIQWPDAHGAFGNDRFKLTQAPASSQGPNRYYIQPMNALNRYVGVADYAQGSPVKLMFPSTDRGLIWHAEPTGDGYLHLVNQNTNLAMNVAGASTANGAPLIQWPRQMVGSSPFHNDHVVVRIGN